MADDLKTVNERLKEVGRRQGRALANIRDDLAALKRKIEAGVDTSELAETLASLEAGVAQMEQTAEDTPDEPTTEPTPTPTPEPQPDNPHPDADPRV